MSIRAKSYLKDTYPEIFDEINKELTLMNHPEIIFELLATKSNKNITWTCGKKHNYTDSASHRVEGRNCPYCSSHKVFKGFNDLEFKNPKLASEWDHLKNDLSPSEVTPFSHKKVWWICEEGHSWQAIIANRSNGRECKQCSKQGESKIESRLANILEKSERYSVLHKSYLSNLYWPHRKQRIEVDLVVLDNRTSKKLFIEVDGSYWHRGRESKDLIKTECILENSPTVILIRLRCEDLDHLPIKHNRLLQVDYDWYFKDDSLYYVVDEISEYLDERHY